MKRTYLSEDDLKQHLDALVEKRLATCKKHATEDLHIYKYSKRVFFDHLWKEDPYIAEARGIVVDGNGKIVQYPFTKVYNYGEYDAGHWLEPAIKIRATRKINGFMAAVSMRESGPLITTTGSFTSPFVDLATRVLNASIDYTKMRPNMTYMFEIVDEADPHIVTEQSGAYLIGARVHQLGSRHLIEETLDGIAKEIGALRPEHEIIAFGDLMARMKSEQIEGYMIRDGVGEEMVCKLKSPYYLRLKFLSRSNYFLKNDIDRADLKKKVEEEFYPLIDWIYDTYGREQFLALEPEKRVELLRETFDTYYTK